jgi:hypothetical protein
VACAEDGRRDIVETVGGPVSSNSTVRVRRGGHVVLACHICNGQVIVPPCVDPSSVVGWVASHG